MNEWMKNLTGHSVLFLMVNTRICPISKATSMFMWRQRSWEKSLKYCHHKYLGIGVEENVQKISVHVKDRETLRKTLAQITPRMIAQTLAQITPRKTLGQLSLNYAAFLKNQEMKFWSATKQQIKIFYLSATKTINVTASEPKMNVHPKDWTTSATTSSTSFIGNTGVVVAYIVDVLVGVVVVAITEDQVRSVGCVKHSSTLHCWFWGPGHSRPPCFGCSLISGVLYCNPSPQNLEQTPHSFQVYWQFTGHGFSWQYWVSSYLEQMVRILRFWRFPMPHGELQGPQQSLGSWSGTVTRFSIIGSDTKTH